jgi:hypothetical protein
VQHQVALGREVVVEPADAHVRRARRVTHREASDADLQDQGRDGLVDLALTGELVLRWTAGFSERHDLFSEQ